MYIRDIADTQHRPSDGLELDSLNEVVDAIQVLGELCGQDSARVKDFAKQARDSLETGMAYSAFAEALTRSSQRTGMGYGPVKGGSLLGGGIVLAEAGKRFFVHNDQGLSRRAPFANLEIRVNEVTEETSVRYLLTVKDLDGQVYPLGLAMSRRCTEAQLALRLQRPRPLGHIAVQATYEPVGDQARFNIAHIVQALQSIDGIKPFDRSTAQVAQNYYRQQCDPMAADFQRLTVMHSSGCKILLAALGGIEQGTAQLESDTVVAGQRSSYERDQYALFHVLPGGDDTTDDQLIELAQELQTQLWIHNYG